MLNHSIAGLTTAEQLPSCSTKEYNLTGYGNHTKAKLAVSNNLEFIAERSNLLTLVRRFFDMRGFLEVQPPCLAQGCIVDPYIDPICIDVRELGLAESDAQSFFLQTSPEMSMKRMLAAGAPSIYSLGPVFRSSEIGQHHNIEFSMLEWYELSANQEQGIKTLGNLACESLGYKQWDVLTYREVFQKNCGFDPITVQQTLLYEYSLGIDEALAYSIAEDRDAMLDLVFTHRIQPQLGLDIPVIVKNYPLSQAALAKKSDDDPECACRFELFVRGVELANGYDELLDADELNVRTSRNNEHRIRTGRKSIRTSSSFVQAMQDGLPPCCGVAMGFDRLLMLKVGASSIDQVIPFTITQT